jgi:phospholipid/cholesterol/gamma-HCH transport system ATP-binding protein
MAAAKIIVKNLKKSFGTKQVLKGVDFEVKEKESFVILGGSGTGKSVLIKCIIGLLLPDPGSQVIIDGKDITFLPMGQREDVMAKVGVLFQGGALFDSLLVWENIAFGLMQRRKITFSQAKAIVAEKLKLVKLGTEVMSLYPVELSGGMQKRVALARAIAADPEIIFFDEPTAGLDPITSEAISELIAECSKKLGATTITITHDMHCARTIADKVAMISEGKFIWTGDGKDLDNPKHPAVAQFVFGGKKRAVA